jgi:hypothetical protein
MDKKRKEKLKQIAVIFSLIVMSNDRINSDDILTSLENEREVFQEWGNPECGDYLRGEYERMPDYLKSFLEENSMHLIITENNDTIEKLYHEVYPTFYPTMGYSSLIISDKLMAIVDGSSHNSAINKSIPSSYSKDIIAGNRQNLKMMMYHQVGHLVDEFYDNISNSFIFIHAYRNDFIKFRQMISRGIIQLPNEKQIIDSTEFFATSFALYEIYPNYLQCFCPNTFEIIDGIVSNMKEKNVSKIK